MLRVGGRPQRAGPVPATAPTCSPIWHPTSPRPAEAEALAKAEARDQNRTNSLSARVDHRGRIRLAGELDPESWATVSAALEPFARPGGLPAPRRQHGGPTPGLPGSGRLMPWSRSAGAPWPPRRHRPASGSPPTSPSPSTTTSCSRRTRARHARTPAPRSPPPTSAASPATPRSSPSCSTATECRSTSAGRSGSSPKSSAAPSRSETAAALSPDVIARRPGATCTTSSTGCSAERPSLDNGVLLCHAHHVVIHRGEWTVRLGRQQTARVHPTRLGRPRSHTPHQHPPPQTLRTSVP